MDVDKITERMMARLSGQKPSKVRDAKRSIVLTPALSFRDVVARALTEAQIPTTGFWDIFLTASSLKISQEDWNVLARIARVYDYARPIGDVTTE